MTLTINKDEKKNRVEKLIVRVKVWQLMLYLSAIVCSSLEEISFYDLLYNIEDCMFIVETNLDHNDLL
uniref:Uncharacterized protein n=1 Tax=Ciona intestinalis TaxID=7719 RepID=H2XKG6_CIOIN